MALPLFSLAQEGIPPKFEIVAWWSPEDAFLYRIEKIKEVYKNGVRSEYDSSAAEILFEVLDSTETNYRLGWTYQESLMGNDGFLSKLPDTILAKLSASQETDPASFIYQTDDVGSLIGIENLAEIRLAMLSKLAIIEDMYSDQKQRDVFRNIMSPLKDAFTSDEGIQQLVAKELQLFHMFYGLAIDSGSVFEYDDQVANLFGGAPIPAKSKVIQTVMDTALGTFTIINEVVPQEKALKQMMGDFVVKVSPDLKEAKKAFKKMEVQMLNRHEVEMYYGYYLPKSINSVQRVEVRLKDEHSLRIERLRIFMPDQSESSEAEGNKED